jgi:Na+/H+ antiporter NhaD/arsenite permease-like protein
MSELQVTLTLVIFAAVILVIALDLMDMMLAALLGVSLMLVSGILDRLDMVEVFNTAGSPLALLFGGMVVARVLAGTGMFERLGDVYLRATGGSGKRYLLLLVGVLAAVCAFLPNATTVILLAPLIIRVAQALKVDFVGPMVLAAVVSNSAGLLTLVGDPATYLVGSSIGMSFGEYMQKVSLAGLLAVLVTVPALRWLMPEIWNTRVALSPARAPARIERPGFVVLALAVLAVMVTLFLIGGSLPQPIAPPGVAIIAATLALLVIYAARAEPLERVLGDVDWKTLVFLAAIFCLVQGFIKTGLLQGLALKLHGWFGTDFTLLALLLLAGIGLLSSVVANIPVVAAALVMTKGYLVAAEVVPEGAMAVGYVDWPIETLPMFIAMMFGATLGGNATLIGASANVVSAGICSAHGERVSFARFMRFGLPITVAQLVVSAIYVLVLTWLLAG